MCSWIFINHAVSSERDAVKLILQHNLYGLDIDDRAYQLAYFASRDESKGVLAAYS